MAADKPLSVRVFKEVMARVADAFGARIRSIEARLDKIEGASPSASAMRLPRGGRGRVFLRERAKPKKWGQR